MLHGAACDQLVSLTMVDARGNLVYADKRRNSDLFAASCGGGGGNFGVVTGARAGSWPGGWQRAGCSGPGQQVRRERRTVFELPSRRPAPPCTPPVAAAEMTLKLVPVAPLYTQGNVEIGEPSRCS